jgi:hypothetical protein
MQTPVAVILVLASVVAFASDPPSDKQTVPPPGSHEKKAGPSAPRAEKESDRELVKKRMRLCRQRPQLCVQHPEKKAPDPAHSPAPDGAGK